MATLRPAQRTAKPPGALLRALGLLYALAAFVAAFALFIYTIPFLVNLRYLKRAVVYPSIDIGPSAPVVWALLVDVSLILLFGLQQATNQIRQ
jgi:hypothetical protein